MCTQPATVRHSCMYGTCIYIYKHSRRAPSWRRIWRRSRAYARRTRRSSRRRRPRRAAVRRRRRCASTWSTRRRAGARRSPRRRRRCRLQRGSTASTARYSRPRCARWTRASPRCGSGWSPPPSTARRQAPTTGRGPTARRLAAARLPPAAALPAAESGGAGGRVRSLALTVRAVAVAMAVAVAVAVAAAAAVVARCERRGVPRRRQPSLRTWRARVESQPRQWRRQESYTAPLPRCGFSVPCGTAGPQSLGGRVRLQHHRFVSLFVYLC